MASADLPSNISGGVRRPLRHDSAHKHVSGEALYVDDIAIPADALEVYIAVSPYAHARIDSMDLSAVLADPDVTAVISAADIPGTNDISPVFGDDPMLADKLVEYVGQPVFAVAAGNRDAAQRAADNAIIKYTELPAILNIKAALAAESYVVKPRILKRGNVRPALSDAPYRISDSFYMGGQEHFYLESQAALALPREDGDVLVHSSSQHPSEVQHLVAKILGRADNAVTVKVRRMGGAFGGKETQAAGYAAIAALMAVKTGRAVKAIPDRDDDMQTTGKRHDFLVEYDVGFNQDGRILGLDVMLASRCGRSVDLSHAVNDRAVFHVDNAYFLEHVHIRNYRCKTHTVSNTAFRGFGGPQGMMVIEHVLDHIALATGLDPLQVRQCNFYGDGKDNRSTTPYGMTVEDNIAPEIVTALTETSGYHQRRDELKKFNSVNRYLKKGLALTPVKFGISFTTTFLNQAGALVHIYTDGSIHLNHGGTEMGQGLFIKVAQVVAETLQVDIDRIKISATSTDKVPNTSATAASSGSDLNGKAAQNAALTIKQRLIEFAAKQYAVTADKIVFENNKVFIGEHQLSFDALVKEAYLARISLSASGYYRTPKINYDAETGQGRPFYYFSYGAALSEVVIDTLTGESRVERVDILHDVGHSLNPAIDLGQIEGGFIQGMGWLTCEELFWNDSGKLMTHAPSTYKIPTAGDRPLHFNMELLADSPNREQAIFRSKAVGEPPLMLAISVFRAISDAIAACGDSHTMPKLDAPATPERILHAINTQRESA